MTKNAKIALGVGVGGLLIFSFIPLWSSGLRRGLNFWQFALSHTVLMRQPCQYIPQEKFSKPLTREELDTLNAIFEAQEIVRPRKIGQLLPTRVESLEK